MQQAQEKIFERDPSALRSGPRASPGGLLQALDYLFLLRPTLFFPVWTVFLAGFFAAQQKTPFSQPFHWTAAGDGAIPIFCALTLLMGSVFILNQIVDVPTDRENDKLFLLANGHIAPRVAAIEAILLGLAGLIIAGKAGAPLLWLFGVIFVVTGLLYSVSPFKMKDRPLAGLLANCLGAMLIFAAGWWTVRPEYVPSLLASVPFALAVGAVYLYTTLPDLKGDSRFDKVTFAVRFGQKWTIFAGLALEVGALVGSWLVQNTVILVPAIIGLFFFSRAAVRRDSASVIQAIKMPIFALAIMLCVIWPLFILILSCTYFAAKAYYRRRFGLRYPTLNSD